MQTFHGVWPQWGDIEIAGLGDGGALVCDNVLGHATARRVYNRILELAREGELRRAGIGRMGGHRLDESIRQDLIAWLTPDLADSFIEVRTLFEQVLEFANTQCWLGLKRFDTQLALYPGDGAQYDRHRDAFAGQNNRRLTSIYYPNVDWEPAHGGQLRLFYEDREEEVEPRGDRMVIFLSEALDHQVLPVFHPRAAVTAWYYGT
ncbi:MAG: 2OG-Fe(II) oxygenase [bacterium]